jgi:hypothetical protein
MPTASELLSLAQNFVQLNFLFSGLEVSSSTLLAARVVALVFFGGSLLWLGFRLAMKLLDCLQTLLAGISALPKTFYLVVLLILPLSSQSLGAKWIGYILLVMGLLGVTGLGVLGLIVWKYGVEHTLRLVSGLRKRERQPSAESGEADGSSHSPLTGTQPPRTRLSAGASCP